MAFHLTINEVIKMWSIKYPKPEDIDTANMLIKVYTQTEQYDKAKEIKAKYQ